MGHLRLSYTLPDTAPWQHVVASVAEGASVAIVAAATTEAAARGLDLAAGDVGYLRTIELLTQLTLAAREEDFAAALTRAGIPVAGAPAVFDLTVAFSDAVEEAVREAHRPSDLGAMARLAAIESLSALLGDRTRSLFEVSPGEVQAAARGFSTEAGFANLFHDFYARFTNRFLGYHLSRELSFHVGGNGRFAGTPEHQQFNADLDHHCRQAALIVRTYAGEWFSKQNWLGGITPAKVRRFGDHCLQKLRAELLVRGARP